MYSVGRLTLAFHLLDIPYRYVVVTDQVVSKERYTMATPNLDTREGFLAWLQTPGPRVDPLTSGLRWIYTEQALSNGTDLGDLHELSKAELVDRMDAGLTLANAKVKRQRKAQKPPEGYDLNSTAAAQYLEIPRIRLQRMALRKELPSMMWNGHYRFNLSDLEEHRRR